MDYTPYEDFKVQAWPNTTICRGSIVVEEGKLKLDKGHGKFLKSDISEYVY